MPPVTIDDSTTNTNNYSSDQLPELNKTLADVPDFSGYYTPKPSASPYTSGRAFDVNEIYRNTLGRNIDPSGYSSYVTNASRSLADIQKELGSSYENRTVHSAQNEVNPMVDAQILAAQQQAGTSRLEAQQKLTALEPAFAQKYGALQLGYNQNLAASDQRLADLLQNYDVTSGRLGQQLGQIPLQAFQMANRRGLLDSSIAYDKLAELARPVQNNLADLTRAYAQNRSTAQRELSNIIQKYQSDRGGLISERAGQAQNIQDALALALKQAQDQAIFQNAQRAAQVNTRSRQFADTAFGQDIQQQTVGLSQQQLAEQARQFNERMALAKQLQKSI